MTIIVKKNIRLAIVIIFMMAFTACGGITPYGANPPSMITLSTASPTRFYTQTSIPKPTNTFSPIDNYLNKIKKLSEECSSIADLSKESSTFKRDWAVYNCRESNEIFIINTDGSKAWQLGYEQLSSYAPDEVPDDIYIIHWSQNNRYIYFFPISSFCCWDPGLAFIGQPVDEIWQFDLITGIRTKITSGYNFNYASFSPNDKTVLLIPQMTLPPSSIDVYDLEKHEISRRIDILEFPNNTSTGDVVWAKNGCQFAVLTASGGDFKRYEEGESWEEPLWSVLIFDLSNLSNKIVVSESRRVIDLFEITDDGILLFAFYEYKADGTTVATDTQYNLTLNEFIITPTPRP